MELHARAAQYDAVQHVILDAVFTCVAQHGFKGLTMRRIAEEAGVSEVALFQMFGGKREMLAAVFQREASRIAPKVGDYTGDLEADLTRIVEAYTDLVERRLGWIMRVMAEVAYNSELRQATHPSVQVLRQVVGIVQGYQQAGVLRFEPPLQVLTALLGPILLARLAHPAGSDGGVRPSAPDRVRAFLQSRRQPLGLVELR